MGKIIQVNCACQKDRDYYLGFGRRDFNQKEGVKLFFCDHCKKFSRSRTAICDDCHAPMQLIYEETKGTTVEICPLCHQKITFTPNGLWD